LYFARTSALVGLGRVTMGKDVAWAPGQRDDSSSTSALAP
jgi:hypothetical protein